jgi:hypothetical protein
MRSSPRTIGPMALLLMADLAGWGAAVWQAAGGHHDK